MTTKVYVGYNKVGMAIHVAIENDIIFRRVEYINHYTQSVSFSKWEQYTLVEYKGEYVIYTDDSSFLDYNLLLDESIKVRLPKEEKLEINNEEFDKIMNNYFNI